MINILDRYSGRKMKDNILKMVSDEFTELDETYLYEMQFSANIYALIYIDKTDYKISHVRIKKETGYRYSIMTALSDVSVKRLDNQIDALFEKEKE